VGSNYADIFGDLPDDDGEGGGGGDGGARPPVDGYETSDDPVEAAYRERQSQIKDDLDNRTGRLWTDEWIIPDEEWMADESFDDIEEWSPKLATRRSLESVRVWEDKGGNIGVPTLGEMASLTLPASLSPHPGHSAGGSSSPVAYSKFRKRRLQNKLRTSIQLAIADDLRNILGMTSWEEKQEAVDALYEGIEERVREREPILGKLPEFGNMVEEGLEKVLAMVHARMQKGAGADAAASAKADDAAEDEEGKIGSHAETDAPEETESGKSSKGEDGRDETNVHGMIDVMGVDEETPVPVFMDLLAATRLQQQHHSERAQAPSDGDGDGEETADPTDSEDNKQPVRTISKFFSQSNDDDVPNLLYPLNVHPNEGVGRMVEEWQLAANKETKRIMMRDTMREIASKIVDAADCCSVGQIGEERKGAARVFVTGERGVGKTAALAGIVASARLSGHIVIYHPDGDRLRKHGFYIEPCQHRGGLWNLPEIAKEFCNELLTSHGEDIAALPNSDGEGGDDAPLAASREYMKEHFTDDHIRRLFRRAYKEDESVTEEEVANMTELPLSKILTVGTGSAVLSSGCYATVISKLMAQSSRPLTVVMDEFNCYYDHGHYFHADYDEHVRKGVPPNRITLFKPFMDAMGLYPEEAGTDMSNEKFAVVDSKVAMMKWGSIVVGTSESRAVKRSYTRSLSECAHALSTHQTHPIHVVDVRRLTNVEVQHVLYNFEITGIGRLRFDRGDTTLNPEEVEYLRLVSGGCGQQLMDACMIP